VGLWRKTPGSGSSSEGGAGSGLEMGSSEGGAGFGLEMVPSVDGVGVCSGVS
jgi:hypothetical protein